MSALPSIGAPASHPPHSEPRYPSASSSSSSSPVSSCAISDSDAVRLSARPKLGSRKSSGSMIIGRDAPITVIDDVPDEGDVRSMSPRRNSAEVDQLSQAARRDLVERAQTLQLSLQAIVDRVEEVKSEHEKLEGGNKFLQSYVWTSWHTSSPLINLTDLSQIHWRADEYVENHVDEAGQRPEREIVARQRALAVITACLTMPGQHGAVNLLTALLGTRDPTFR